MPKILKHMGEGHGKGDLYPLLDAFLVDITALQTLVNDLRNRLIGDALLGVPTLAIGSTTDHVSSIAFDFIVNGKVYKKAAVAAGTAPGNDVIPQNKYGAVAFDIGINGTIDAIEAAANATGYTSAALAIAGIPAVGADHVRMGTVTAMKSDGDFTFDTTALNAANTTVAYTDGTCVFAALGAAVSLTVTS